MVWSGISCNIPRVTCSFIVCECVYKETLLEKSTNHKRYDLIVFWETCEISNYLHFYSDLLALKISMHKAYSNTCGAVWLHFVFEPRHFCNFLPIILPFFWRLSKKRAQHPSVFMIILPHRELAAAP